MADVAWTTRVPGCETKKKKEARSVLRWSRHQIVPGEASAELRELGMAF